MNKPRACLVPNVSGVGGMVSFRSKLIQGLTERGIAISTSLHDGPFTSILVIGGMHELAGLWRAKRRGVRIVQRLDGMNWIHRKRRTGWRHYMRAEYGNLILSQIRSRIADHVVYQSDFSRQWWERVYKLSGKPWSRVYNGVNLDRYTPNGQGKIPQDRYRILIVEGSIGGGYEWGLETGIQLAEALKAAHSQEVELMVVGRVAEGLQADWKAKAKVQVSFIGQVPPERIPELDRSAHLLYAADINAACPNSVIEAMACGLPVVGFDTGALTELVAPKAGRITPYGGDPWKLDTPDITGLAEAASAVIKEQPAFRAGARVRAEEAFGLDKMVDGYLDALNL